MATVTIWLQQIRAPFLILSVFLTLIGIGMADFSGVHHWLHAALLMLGVIVCHIGVNLFNEISDYQTKIDENTKPTPFSGGSGMIQSGKTNVQSVVFVAYAMLVIAFAVGLYFCFVSGWMIGVFMIFGGIAIRFYTSHLARWLLGEIAAGLTLGSMVVMGVYYAMTSTLPLWVIYMSIPSGILTFLLLFLNEFPDLEADQKGGRYHLLIHFGRKKCRWIYGAILFCHYILIGLAPFLLNLSYFVLLGLGTLPVAIIAFHIVLKFYDQLEKLIPALGLNVMVVLVTDLLLAIGFFFA